MIGCLRGKIVKIASDYLLLDVMGVGYKLFCAKHLLQNCMIGEDKFFYIETAVGDDYIKLYGFESEDILYLLPLLAITDTLIYFLILSSCGAPIGALLTFVEYKKRWK